MIEASGFVFFDLPLHWQLLPVEFRLFLVGILSAMLGSFLNMAIWRVPRGISIVFPRSHCPVCSHVLGFVDLLPLVGWLILRGRCRYCRSRFGLRYLWVELVMVVGGLFSYLYFGSFRTGMLFFIFFAFFVFGFGIKLHKFLDAGIEKQRKAFGKGFTFIEIMMAVVIVSSIIIPFGNLFLSSYSRTLRNQEYTMAYNLIEEALEEMKLVPFSRLKSSYELYGEDSYEHESIFRDEHIGDYQKMKVDKDYFYKNFSDIQTQEHQFPLPIQKKFLRRYEETHRRKYQFYPKGYEIFKRNILVEPVKMARDAKFDKNPPDQKKKEELYKLTVVLWIDSQLLHKKIEMSMYRSR